MNEIEKQRFNKESRVNLPLFGKIVLVLLLIFVLIKSFDLNDLQDRDDGLISIDCIVSEAPAYTKGAKHNPRRYSFKVIEYHCQFWIISDPLDFVLDNKKVKERIEQIKPGDSLTITILKTEEIQINELNFQATVLGLSDSEGVLFRAEQIDDLVISRTKLQLTLAIVLFFIILAALIWDKVKSKSG